MKKLLTTIVAAILLTGCAGVANLRLNEELTNLYAAQIDARNEQDVILQETVVDAFSSLATRAEAQATSASSTADAVSFYRIAATAAWQGRSDSVVALSNAGWKRCNEARFRQCAPGLCDVTGHPRPGGDRRTDRRAGRPQQASYRSALRQTPPGPERDAEAERYRQLRRTTRSKA